VGLNGVSASSTTAINYECKFARDFFLKQWHISKSSGGMTHMFDTDKANDVPATGSAWWLKMSLFFGDEV